MADFAESLNVLVPILERAQQLGFLGREPVQNHLSHSLRYCVPAVSESDFAMDIGSGGGIPGLALAVLYPDVSWTLLDVMAKRCAFLRESVAVLGIADRVVVLEGRAEELARLPQYRSQFDVVTARSFGAPAVLAECASPFLRVGGHIVVSEPPDERGELGELGELGEPVDRWSSSGLETLGLFRVSWIDTEVAVLEQSSLCGEKYPRRIGVPSKRPLF